MQCRNNSLSYLVIYFIFLLFYFFIILFCLCILKILVTHFIIRRLAWNSKCPSRFCFTGRVASSPFLLCILSVKFGYKPVTTKPQWFSVSKIPRLRNWEGDMNDGQHPDSSYACFTKRILLRIMRSLTLSFGRRHTPDQEETHH